MNKAAKALTALAGAWAIWELMEQTAVATAKPNDGRASGYRKAAADFGTLFYRRAAELHATPKQVAEALAHKTDFQKFAQQQFAQQASQN